MRNKYVLKEEVKRKDKMIIETNMCSTTIAYRIHVIRRCSYYSYQYAVDGG